MVRYYAKIATKLTIVLSAMLRDMLTWSTPLEFAACLHFASAYMHRYFYTYDCQPNHCRAIGVSALSAQAIATIALALLILGLSVIHWHVPRWVRSQHMLCHILTAMPMQALRLDLACTAMAFLLPTFGNISQDQGGTSRKRATARRPATEPTLGTPVDAEATSQDPGAAPPLRRSGSATEPDAATMHIAPVPLGSTREASLGSGDMAATYLADAVPKLASECDDTAAALRSAVRTLRRGGQAYIRNICKPWGVQLHAKHDSDSYNKRGYDVLKRELTATLVEARQGRTSEPQQLKPSSSSVLLPSTRGQC